MRTFCLVVPTSEGQDGMKVGVNGDLNPEADKSPHKERGTNMCVSERKKQRHGLCVKEKIHECSKLCVFIYDNMSRADLKTGKWMFILVRSSLIVSSFVFPCLQKQWSSFLAGAPSALYQQTEGKAEWKPRQGVIVHLKKEQTHEQSWNEMPLHCGNGSLKEHSHKNGSI